MNNIFFLFLNSLSINPDSSSDDDASIPEEREATPDREYNYPRDHLLNSREKMKLSTSREHAGRHVSNIAERRPQNLPPPVSIFCISHI